MIEGRGEMGEVRREMEWWIVGEVDVVLIKGDCTILYQTSIAGKAGIKYLTFFDVRCVIFDSEQKAQSRRELFLSKARFSKVVCFWPAFIHGTFHPSSTKEHGKVEKY